jgi:hypothetical protein
VEPLRSNFLVFGYVSTESRVAPGISRCQNTSDSRMSSLGKIDRTRTLAFSRDLPLLHSLSHGPASLCSSIPSRREELRRRPSSGESVAPLLLPSRPSLLPHRQICLYFCRPLFFPRCRRSASQLLLLHFPLLRSVADDTDEQAQVAICK